MNCAKMAWLGFGTSMFALAAPALAQPQTPPPAPSEEQAPAASDESEKEEIVVTGTLLRGIDPAGSATVGLSSQDIAETGAQSTNQLLTTIPQVSNFGQLSSPGVTLNGATGASSLSINHQIQIQRPVLRDLLQTGAIGSTVTLILVDGHRVVGAGVGDASPDPDVVPPGVLERVEIVLDGGSSLYGADAVGGVINFITRRRFDGIELNARYGFADDYYAYDANLTVGESWSNGGAYLSYNFAKNDEIYGIDRDFIQAINWGTGLPTGRQCDVANIGVGTRSYALPGLGLGTFNACDVSDFQTIVPAEKRHSFLASFNQELTDWLEFDLKAFYTRRDSESNGGPLGTSVSVATNNPLRIPLQGQDANAAQTVQFNYAPIRGNFGNWRNTHVREWGITSTLKADLGSQWQLRLLGNYGESSTWFRNQDINTTLQQQYVNAALLNPYNIAAAPNSVLVDNVLDWQNYGEGKSSLLNFRAVFDGPLMSLPGGEMRLAAGAEYIRETYQSRSGFTVLDGEDTLTLRKGSRNVKALFGELFVPIFGPDNATPGFHALNISASVRHDRYSDFGSTTNPKIGVTYEPLNWLRLRGAWAKSFNAPTISNQLSSLENRIQATNAFIVTPPGGPAAPAGSYNLTLLGSVADLQPQTATSWSIGAELLPTLVPGVRASINYYNVEFRGQLARAPIFDAAQLFRDFPQYATLFPTDQQIADFVTGTANAQAIIAQFVTDPNGPQVYEILDYRLRNLGTTRVRGIDFSIRYDRQTSYGSVDAEISGNYQLGRKFAASSSAAFIETDMDTQTRLKLAATLGTNIGGFRAQARWNHVGGYDVVRSATILQDKVNAYNTIDLYFQYKLPNFLGLERAALTLNIINALDSKPPIFRSNGSTGIAFGNPIGRLIQFGVQTRF